MYMCIVYVHTYIHTYIHTYAYIYIERERAVCTCCIYIYIDTLVYKILRKEGFEVEVRLKYHVCEGSRRVYMGVGIRETLKASDCPRLQSDLKPKLESAPPSLPIPPPKIPEPLIPNTRSPKSLNPKP